MGANFHTDWDANTSFTTASMNPAIQALDLAISNGLRFKAVAALADTAVTLTAAQMVTSGIITTVPTTARSQQSATAANIIAAITTHPTGTCFEFTIINTAAFDETLTTNTGVTLAGNMVVNNGSATFLVLVTSATTVTIYRK